MGETPVAQASARETPEVEGSIEGYKGHGVFVPSGLSAAAIMEGAWALEQKFDVAPFVSRMMARAVLEAIGNIKGHAHSLADERKARASSSQGQQD